MTRRRPIVRAFTLLWATLQLAAPGVSSIADGLLTLDSASRPTTHVEATTSDSCPIVHSLDCAVCRFLSTSSADDAASPSVDWQTSAVLAPVVAASASHGCATHALPLGRAPPTA